jgi:PAS domain S-box-containing protein
MPTPEIVARAELVRAHLERGELAGLGPVLVRPNTSFVDAELAARVVLADVDHRADAERRWRPPGRPIRWDDLVTELGALQRVAARRDRLRHRARWDWDLTTDRVRWSDALCRIFGLTPGAAPSTLAASLTRLHPEDVQRVRAIVDAARLAGGCLHYQARLVRPDGAVRVFRSRGIVRGDARGQPARIQGTVRDVTERGAVGA